MLLPRCAALLACCAAATAAAQQESSRKDIIVQGRRPPSDKALRKFVWRAAPRVEGQLSRFADPVCPLVAGLSPASNRAIEARIRQVAVEAEMREAKPACSPNLVLIIAHDADTFVTALRRRFPALFGDLDSAEMQRAFASGPVHAWNSVEVQNEDGERISASTDDGVKILVVRRASRILEATRQVVLRSVVVIDSQATLGKSLTQIADYAAMRTLAGARPPEQAEPADTILTLFDDASAPPAALTALDRGFLRGLYRTQPNGRAATEANTILREIARETKAGD